MTSFELFGLQHILVLTLVVILSVGAYSAGHGPNALTWNRLGTAFFAFYAVILWAYKIKDGWNWDNILPFALCDLVFLGCLACFISPRPILITLVTYWGLTGTIQALITPDVSSAFPSSEFVLFFIGHSAIIPAIFFLVSRNYHPALTGWQGMRDSALGLLAYVCVASAVNGTLHVNYGYLSRKPKGASILDYFGPWPYYVLGGFAIALASFFVLSFTLKLLKPRAQQRETEPNSDGTN